MYGEIDPNTKKQIVLTEEEKEMIMEICTKDERPKVKRGPKIDQEIYKTLQEQDEVEEIQEDIELNIPDDYPEHGIY